MNPRLIPTIPAVADDLKPDLHRLHASRYRNPGALREVFDEASQIPVWDAVGGRMLIPVGSRETQRLILVRRTASDILYEEVLDCTFVPLLGRFGWAEPGDEGSLG